MLFKKGWLKKRLQTPVLDTAFDASLLGLHLVTNTFVGLGIGYFLDRWLVTTKPWLTVLFLLFGIAAGFKSVYVEATKILAREDKYRKDTVSSPSQETETRGDASPDNKDTTEKDEQ